MTTPQASRVAVIGTLDTKSAEIDYIAHAFKDRGVDCVIIDSGILGRGTITATVTREEVAAAAGKTLLEVQNAGSRGAAVELMQAGLRKLVPELASAGRIQGVICLGGAEGALMGAAAMHELPVGFPKIIVSPSASGRREFGPFMGSVDVMVMHSVIDILGLNAIAVSVFDNAVAAMVGMVTTGGRPPRRGDNSVGVTMLGQTTPGASAMCTELEAHGYEPIIFHANGVGGPAMDMLASQGALRGVIDFTLSELANSVMGGLHATPPGRMRTAAVAGLPLVVVPGAADFFNQGPRDSVPQIYAGRAQYFHNPVATLVRMSPEEMAAVGSEIAEVVLSATGPVRVIVPTGGLSLIGVPGGPIADAQADKALADVLIAKLGSSRVQLDPAAINDADFGCRVATAFIELDRAAHHGEPAATPSAAERTPL